MSSSLGGGSSEGGMSARISRVDGADIEVTTDSVSIRGMKRRYVRPTASLAGVQLIPQVFVLRQAAHW